MPFAYLYELRRGDQIVATGHLSNDTKLLTGSQISIGTHTGTVRSITPISGQNESRLIIDLPPKPPGT